MRLKCTQLAIALLLVIGSFAQTPIHEFSFDNTLSNTTNTATLVSSLSLNTTTLGFTSNRYGESNKAFMNVNTAAHLTATFTNLPVGTSARSIEFWVKFLPGYSGDHFLVSYGTNGTNQAYGLTQNTTSVVNYGWANDLTIGLTYTTNTWYHYVITYDGITAAIYRNGQLVSNANKSWNTVGQFLRIGSTPAGNVGFCAAIDDMKIYNIALTATQVQNIFNNIPLSASIGASPNGLLGYYSFETNYNSHNGTHNFNIDAASGLNSVSAGISDGRYGKGLDVGFGTGAISNTSLSAALNNKFFTVACWVNKNGNNNYSSAFELFCSAFFRYNYAVSNAQEFAMAISSTSYQASTSSLLPANTWVHIALVFDQDGSNNYRLRLFQNGINIATKNIGTTATFYQFNNKAVIGGGTNADGSMNASKYFKGLIDEVYIYDRAISDAEVLNLMYNTNGIVLPSKLSSFTGKLLNQTAQLSWSTSSEINTSNFDLEYSTNGKEFTTVQNIVASGYSASNKQYTTTHQVGNADNHYYRLKMVDKDGSFTYSQIIKLKGQTKQFESSVYPTVANSTVNISIATVVKSNAFIRVVSGNGQTVLQKTINLIAGSQTELLNIAHLPNGTYKVTVMNDTKTDIHTIIKQ